jgi:hypothetical protein
MEIEKRKMSKGKNVNIVTLHYGGFCDNCFTKQCFKKRFITQHLGHNMILFHNCLTVSPKRTEVRFLCFL